MVSQIFERVLLAVLALVLLAPPVAWAQAPEAEDLMVAFGRRTGGEPDMTVVHLNDLTTDLLFEAPAKYSLRAQARQATMFYVQGTAASDITLDLAVELVGARILPGRLVSISNFEPGTELSEGDSFAGIIAFEELLDIRSGFKLNIGDRQVEYTFTPNQLGWLAEAANP